MKYIINPSISNKNTTSHVNIGGNEFTMGGNEANIGGNGAKSQQINALTNITSEKKRLDPDKMLELIIDLCKIEPLSAKEIANYLSRDYNWIKKEYISKLVKQGKLSLLYPDKPKSPNQKYFSK